MLSFPSLLMNRELGLPGAQSKITEAIERNTADNLVNDNCDSGIIELPENTYNRLYRYKDSVAVLSFSKIDKKVETLALWSLQTKCKLWDVKITKNYKESCDYCKLTEEELVLIDSTDYKIIVFNGKESGELPMRKTLYWKSIIPIGKKILGCWAERKETENIDPCWIPENTNVFFGEWDHTGKCLKPYQLDYTRGRWTYEYVGNENFWVRMSGHKSADLASIIEVFDRILGSMKTFELPLNPAEEEFTTSCLVKNQLFFGKNVIRPYGKYNNTFSSDPTIYIYDLVKGAIIGEFPTGAKEGIPKYLVANEYYAAWLEYNSYENNRVKYLDIKNKKIMDATNIPYNDEDSKVNLSIAGTILSIIYAEGGNTSSRLWKRKVIDMKTNELKSEITYKRFSWTECSMSDGILVIPDGFHNGSRLHIESFIGQSLNKDKSTSRKKVLPGQY